MFTVYELYHRFEEVPRVQLASEFTLGVNGPNILEFPVVDTKELTEYVAVLVVSEI
jgi:hypothetical protein